ncbi:four-helix bundle copper-binding protein [Niallia sp. 03133]|uniref:four-helix bundle copper-binding protein n=1 Tax=Niallia sp. 03133 TaxID=3458060 RepID=UPI0040442602
MMVDERDQLLIQALEECMVACNHCLMECLAEENVGMMIDCIRIDRECAEFCAYLEQAIIRKSPYILDLTKLCLSVCKACAEECSKHDHKHCQYCADICRQCADECEKYLQ